jgi:DNA-binding NarL/FixJ family response regulator
MSDDIIRILIVDDHLLFRDGVRTLLIDHPQMALVGEAATGEDALLLAKQLQPTVILMDLRLPGMNGIEATRQIVQISPKSAIVMLTMFDDDTSVFTAMAAGARGYILKGASHDEMLRAITAAAHGEAIFSPGIATRMMQFFGQLHVEQQQKAFPELSEREREVLLWIARGQTNQEISRALKLSLKTVQNHVSSILNKLQVVDREHTQARAQAAGLGTTSDS